MNLCRLHRTDQSGFDLSEETVARIESPKETETCNRRFCNKVPVLFSDYCGDHMGDES